jgi:hypothetical protein
MLIDYLTLNYMFEYFFYLLFDCVINFKYIYDLFSLFALCPCETKRGRILFWSIIFFVP